MAKDKPSFVLYNDQIDLFHGLSDREAGKLIKIIFSYVNDKNPEVLDKILKIAFEPIKRQLKRDLIKYEHRRSANYENARKRWDAKKCESHELASNGIDENAKNAVNGNVNVTVNDNGNVIKKERKGFAPPSLEEVINYMSEKIDEFSAMGEAQKFINYYDSNGWMVGKNKMKNWRGAAAGWISRKDNFKNNDNGKLGTSAARIAALKNL